MQHLAAVASAVTTMTSLLDVKGLAAGYGGPLAVFDATFSVGRGELVALLGANGAGKTTSLLAIAGFLSSSAGDVLLDGKSIRGLPPHIICPTRPLARHR